MTTQRPLSVAMVGKYFPPVRGGIEEYVQGLAEAACSACDVTVIVHATGRRSRLEENGRYRVVQCATWFNAASQPVSPGLFTALSSRHFDIVHLHVPNVLGILAVLTCAKDARIVVTHHADMVGFGLAGRVAIALYRRLLRRASAITVLSLKNRDLARDVGVTQVPFVALPVGLEAERFARTPERAARAEKLRASLPPDHLIVGFVGRLVPYKGLDVLIDALAATPGVSCLIAGDGRERVALVAAANAKGVAQRMRFLGEVSEEDRLALLHACDVFVLPSINSAEAFGIAQVEAQFCGLPVIATDLLTGVTDVTRNGETGIVVEPGQASALAAAIMRLKSDGELRRRMGDAGRARAQALYSVSALRERLLALYALVAGRSG